MSKDGKGILILGALLIILAPVSFVLPSFTLLPKNFALAGLIFLFLGVFFIGIWIYQRAKVRREEEICEEGIEGTANLVNWWIIGKSGGELGAVEFCMFELNVTIEGKPPYKVKHRQLVPFGVYNQLNKGMVLPVKMHRKKPEQMMLDWERGGGGFQRKLLRYTLSGAFL